MGLAVAHTSVVEHTSTPRSLHPDDEDFALDYPPSASACRAKTPLELEAYVGADWAECKMTKTSTMGCVVVLLGCCVGLTSNKSGLVGIV